MAKVLFINPMVREEEDPKQVLWEWLYYVAIKKGHQFKFMIIMLES